MNKKILIIAAVLVAVIIAGAALWLPGRYVDQGLKQLEANSGDIFDVTVDKTSSSVFDLHFQLKEDDFPLAVNVKNELKKSIGKSTITHEVFLDASVLDSIPMAQHDWVTSHLVDQPMLTGETTFDLLGNYSTHFESIAIDQDMGEFKVNAVSLVGDVSGDATGDIALNLQWPGLTITANDPEKGRMKILPLAITAEGQYLSTAEGQYLSSALFIGEQKLTGEGIDIQDGTDSANQRFKLSNYVITSEVYEEDERLQGKAIFSFDALNVEDSEQPLSITGLKTEIGFGGLERENLQRLNVAVNDMPATGGPSPAVMEELNQLLRNGFSLGFNNWQAKLNDLPFNMDANLELTENQLADLQNPMSFIGLLGNLTANMDMTFDAGIAEIPQLSDAVFSLQMTGALVKDGDQYTMNFSMANGLPQLNGEVLQLPGL